MAVHPPCQPPPPSLPAYPPPTRYQFSFPSALDAALLPLDDPLISLCQRRTAGLTHIFAMSLTFFTAIETSLIFPAALFALGYDRSASLSTTVLFVLAISSQIPKKFIHRPRPWMTSRALPIRTDKTSSFPSRAVVCAVVFLWLIFQNFPAINLHPVPTWSLIIFFALLTAFARVNVGAHYPSDTIAGFLLALLILRTATCLEDHWTMTTCPQFPTSTLIPTASHLLSIQAVKTLVISTAFAYALALLSMQGFWVKCSYVYGLLLAPATFRAAYLCGSTEPLALMETVVGHAGVSEYVSVGAFFLTLLLFGMATRSRKGPFRVVVFSVIYFGTLLGIVVFRLLRAPVGH